MIHAPYMTIHLVMSLPKIPYIHRIYIFIYLFIYKVRQDHTYAPYMTIHLVMCLLKAPFMHQIILVLAKPSVDSSL